MATDKSDFFKDNLKYVDKEKALAWLTQPSPREGSSSEQGLNAEPEWSAQPSPKEGSSSAQGFDVAKVIKDFENPSITPAIIEQMTAWHGSPHKHEGFDHSHIGSGEGEYAHGWGSYVAFSQEVGRGYAKALGRGYSVRYVGREEDHYKRDALRDMAATMERGGMSFEEAKESCLRLYGNRWEPTHKWKRQAIEEARKEDFETSRYLYEVDIPDDTGDNYLTEGATIPKKHRARIADVVRGMDEGMLLKDGHGPNWLP